MALAVLPALSVVDNWGGGCQGDDVCVGAVFLGVMTPLTFLALGLGLFVRWSARELNELRQRRRRAAARLADPRLPACGAFLG